MALVQQFSIEILESKDIIFQTLFLVHYFSLTQAQNTTCSSPGAEWNSNPGTAVWP